MKTTTLVVPCYNEAERLDRHAFVDAVDSREWLSLLFVDDGSTDATPEILRRLAARRQRIGMMELPRNRGKAEAVRCGMLRGLESESKIVGFWDADLATPFAELDAMCRLLEEKDALMVVGSRVKLLGRQIERNPVRHYLGRVFATAVSEALDVAVYDTQCGAKIFSNEPLIHDVFDTPFRTSWIFDAEIFERIIQHQRRSGEDLVGSRVVEYPLRRWVHAEGSKLRVRDFLRSGLDVAGLAYRMWRSGARGD